MKRTVTILPMQDSLTEYTLSTGDVVNILPTRNGNGQYNNGLYVDLISKSKMKKKGVFRLGERISISEPDTSTGSDHCMYVWFNEVKRELCVIEIENEWKDNEIVMLYPTVDSLPKGNLVSQVVYFGDILDYKYNLNPFTARHPLAQAIAPRWLKDCYPTFLKEWGAEMPILLHILPHTRLSRQGIFTEVEEWYSTGIALWDILLHD